MASEEPVCNHEEDITKSAKQIVTYWSLVHLFVHMMVCGDHCDVCNSKSEVGEEKPNEA